MLFFKKDFNKINKNFYKIEWWFEGEGICMCFMMIKDIYYGVDYVVLYFGWLKYLLYKYVVLFSEGLEYVFENIMFVYLS